MLPEESNPVRIYRLLRSTRRWALKPYQNTFLPSEFFSTPKRGTAEFPSPTRHRCTVIELRPFSRTRHDSLRVLAAPLAIALARFWVYARVFFFGSGLAGGSTSPFFFSGWWSLASTWVACIATTVASIKPSWKACWTNASCDCWNTWDCWSYWISRVYEASLGIRSEPLKPQSMLN